ncbi:concanavalin A-like lectin/glucanase domain-containing protein, partial [Ochromonadaceae sp. CCMP2298]
DCIAVGLATSAFQKHTRLPGWDNESWGFHGDDGAIFHGCGKQLARFGPTFGVGDTVGCGFDAREGTIFYTLNGNNLGTAF